MLDLTHLRLEDVQGVGTIELDLEPGKQAYVFIGANGVGKTKLLETIYKLLYVTHKENIVVERYSGLHSDYSQASVYDEKTTEYYLELDYITPDRDHFTKQYKLGNYNSTGHYSIFDLRPRNPVIFIETKDRGFFESPSITLDSNKLKLETKDSVKKWILEMAYASNPFQKERSKKENAIKSMFKLLNLIDRNYDPDFIEIDDHENIYIKVDGKIREFSELSTGYSSLLKIIQIIISRYAEWENKKDLQNIEGIVLIDEIESHLHLEWQVKIIPTLKKLFPNTTFFIATHSPLVLSQLDDGEAYELRRDTDDVVRTHKIKNPGNTAMIDLLQQAFHIDLNRLALERPISDSQKAAKQKLLKYLRERKAS